MSNVAVFKSRDEAGRRLAARLAQLKRPSGTVTVVGLATGGVPVAAAIARELRLPLDVLLVETLRSGDRTIGAVTRNTIYLDTRIFIDRSMTRLQVDVLRTRAVRTLTHRANLYEPVRPDVDLRDATVVLVDDAIVSGATMRAAIDAVRLHRPAEVIVATPIASSVARQRLAQACDGFFSIGVPLDAQSAAQLFSDFEPPTDDDVVRLLADASTRRVSAA